MVCYVYIIPEFQRTHWCVQHAHINIIYQNPFFLPNTAKHADIQNIWHDRTMMPNVFQFVLYIMFRIV